MVGPFLKEATIIIVFCQIFVSGEDLLEVFRPNPSLPQELNDWLSKVQEHKADFRLIRDSIGEEPKRLFNLNEDYEEQDSSNKEDSDDISVNRNHKHQSSEGVDDRPKNDIYPYIYQGFNTNLPNLDKSSLKMKRLSSKKGKSPARLRRSSNDTPFFENGYPIKVESAGKVGELKRTEAKYPDSLTKNHDKISEKDSEKLNVAGNEENLIKNEDKKREIQIDIKNDGKLVKQIHEDSKNPKSIVLNIQPPEMSLDPIVNPKLLEPNINNFNNNYKGFHANSQELTENIHNIPDVNIRSESNQIKNKEIANNYNNLFTANEHLNTDNSLARESTTSNNFIHHMSLPEPNPYHQTPYPNANNKPPQNNYNNNMRDMSSYWTTYEKNQMQKGLDRARINKNYVVQNIKTSPNAKPGNKVKESATGFEPAQRIELESDTDTNDQNNIDSKSVIRSDNYTAALNMNSFSNLNNLKDMNVNDITNSNSLNGIKFISSPNGTNNFIGVSGTNVISPVNYEENFGHNKGVADQNNFSNIQDLTKQNKRQLEVLPENLPSLNNFQNLTGDTNLDLYRARFMSGIKRSDVINPANLFEKVNALERENGSAALNELSVNPVIGGNIESSELEDKTANDINVDSSLNNNENIPSVGDEALKGKETGIGDNGVPDINSAQPSNADTGPVGVVEDEFVDHSFIQPLEETAEAYPLGNELSRLPGEHHKNSKHIKTIIRKINKNVKNNNKVTEIETITEIDYSVAEHEHSNDMENESENEAENIDEMGNESCEEPESNDEPHHEDASGEEVNEHVHDNGNEISMNCDEPEENEGKHHHHHHHHEEHPVIEINGHHENAHEHGDGKETLMEIDIDSGNNPENHHHHHHEAHHNSELEEKHHEEEEHEGGHHVDHEKETVIDIETHHEPQERQLDVHHLLRDLQNPVLYDNPILTHRNSDFNRKSNDALMQNIKYMYPERILLLSNKPYNFRNKKHSNNKRFPINYMKDLPSPAELIIRKRNDDDDGYHPRKRFRKRNQDNKIDSLFEGIGDNKLSVDTSSIANDFIPSLIGRRLKSVDYAYDAYLHMPGEADIDEESSTDLQNVASKEKVTSHVSTVTHDNKKNHRAGPVHKNSVEGDYGEEEDTVTESRKKSSNNIIKKTQNEFANPRTTTEGEDYENYDDYDNVSSIQKQHPRSRQTAQRYRSRMKSPLRGIHRVSIEKERGMKGFAHHRHKYKSRGKPRQTRRSEFEEQGDRDTQNSVQHQQSPVAQSEVNILPNLKRVDANSDFQHWPSFVVEDNKNEEKLRKRSPVLKKKYPRAFNFPLASKDFFVKPQNKSITEVKREKPNPFMDDVNLISESTKLPLDDAGKVTGSTEKSSNVTGTTDSDDDVDTCSTPSTVANVCEDKENFNKSAVELTTILAIIPEGDSASEECESRVVDLQSNTTVAEGANPEGGEKEGKNTTVPDKLDDMLNGKLPINVVHNVMDNLAKNPKLKNRFHKGFKPSDQEKNYLRTMNETGMENQNLVQSMTSIISKLQYSATCQSLPHKLKHYLKTITHGHKGSALDKTKEMEEVEFDEGQNQENFIFESSPRGDNFEGKVKILQDLLERFNKLPDKCKTRAMPVKEYIENHLGMLNNMLNTMNSEAQKNAKPKKSIEPSSNDKFRSEDELIEEQLESLGLGKKHQFKPKFDLDQMVENKLGRSNSGNKDAKQSQNVNKRELNADSRSKKYEKLVDAVRRLRMRREGRRRLGEMYGRSESEDYDGFDNFGNRDNRGLSKANFESPLVYSL